MAREFIDCYSHVSANEFARAGLKALGAVTEGGREFERVINLCKVYPGFKFLCVGIPPLQGSGQDLHSIKIQVDITPQRKVLEPFLPLFQTKKDDIVAVGEIGLDFTPCYAQILRSMMNR